MNSNNTITELSLYQFTQKSDKPLTTITVGAETLKSYVAAIIDLAIEQQLKAKVWVKLPQTKSWLQEIQKYQQQGNGEQIYFCSTHKNHPALSSLQESNHKTPVLPVKLNKNSTLQKESFLVILSPEFSVAILAQWQKGKVQIDASGKRLQQPYLQMISSFESPVIQLILTGIQQVVASQTDNHFLSPQDFDVPMVAAKESTLLASLLLKQIKQTEEVQTYLHSLPPANQKPEIGETVLGLQQDFLNNLVRELRSPITHMKTALSLLESKQIKGEQRQRYLQMVSNECDRQNSLVSGLLELLQLDTPTQSEHIYLEDFVPGIVSTYQPLAEEKEIQLGYTIAQNLPPVSCPTTWLRQIIINLLNNSLQFTPAQGKVSVQAALKDESIELTVSDTGIGIESKELNKIFEGFYRTQAITTKGEKISGAGLGLTIVQQLVQRSGGKITVSSKVGKGSAFKVLLPAVPAELITDESI